MSDQASVSPFDPAHLAEAVADFAPDAVVARWCGVDRSSQRPRLVTVSGADGRITGLALITSRPGTAAVKIVDALGDIAAVIATVDAHAREVGAVAIKWECWRPVAAVPGFAELTPPRLLGADGPPAGRLRWLQSEPGRAPDRSGPVSDEPAAALREPGHYRQTTHFTCGAVCVSIAEALLGNLDPADFDQRHELGLWREATNILACDPVRLGHATLKRWPTSSVRVALDAHGPVLLDSYPKSDREWRRVLQQISLEEAVSDGLPVTDRRLNLPEIRTMIGQGHCLALLVSLETMMAVAAPHWILCHGTVPGAVVVEDPWVSADLGESWVDAHMMPIADPTLDVMSIMEDGRYRAAVIISQPDSEP